MEGLRVAVTSDSHIGRRYPTLEFREQDINDGFKLLLEELGNASPDAMIHAGDLFDTVFPPGWIFDLGLTSLQSAPRPGKGLEIKEVAHGQANQSNIFIIHGNHDGSADARCESGCFSVLKYFDSMSLVNYMDVRKLGEEIYLPRFILEGGGVRVGIQGIGHRSTTQFQNLFAIAQPLEGVDHNILVVHQSIADLTTPYTRGEILPMDTFVDRGFDLVVAGHTHRSAEEELRGTKFLVPGSTERIDSGEFGEGKAYYLLDITPDDILYRRVTLDVDSIRRIRSYAVDVDGLSGSEITRQCVDAVTEPSLEEALLYFIIRGETPHGYMDVDKADIEGTFRERGARAVKVNTKNVVRRDISRMVADGVGVQVTEKTLENCISERTIRDLAGNPIRDPALIALLARAAFAIYQAYERGEKEAVPAVLEKEIMSVAESLHREGEEEA
jgi:DNA repair exonuclease SbcCD nuclease subunit